MSLSEFVHWDRNLTMLPHDLRHVLARTCYASKNTSKSRFKIKRLFSLQLGISIHCRQVSHISPNHCVSNSCLSTSSDNETPIIKLFDYRWTRASSHRERIYLVTSLFFCIGSQLYEDLFITFGLVNTLCVLRWALRKLNTFRMNYSIVTIQLIRCSVKGF